MFEEYEIKEEPEELCPSVSDDWFPRSEDEYSTPQGSQASRARKKRRKAMHSVDLLCPAETESSEQSIFPSTAFEQSEEVPASLLAEQDIKVENETLYIKEELTDELLPEIDAYHIDEADYDALARAPVAVSNLTTESDLHSVKVERCSSPGSDSVGDPLQAIHSISLPPDATAPYEPDYLVVKEETDQDVEEQDSRMDSGKETPKFSGSENRRYCSVPGCVSRQGQMFYFPKHPSIRETWRLACSIQRTVSNSMFVCIKHFREADLELSVYGKFQLKKGAMPSLHLPDTDVKKRKKNGQNCVVCDSDRALDGTVTMHSFPRCPKRRAAWQEILCLEMDPTPGTKICSRHFEDSNFRTTGQGKRVLKNNAFPSSSIPVGSRSTYVRSSSSRSSSTVFECPSNEPDPLAEDSAFSSYDELTPFVDDMGGAPLVGSAFEICSGVKQEVLPFGEGCGGCSGRGSSPVVETVTKAHSSLLGSMGSSKASQVRGLLPLRAVSEDFEFVSGSGSPQSSGLSFKTLVNAQTQVELPGPTLINFLHSDWRCRAFTGVTLKLLNTLSDLCQELKPVSPDSVLTMKERVTIVLSKLYLNISFECLAVLFGVDSHVCSNSFGTTLHLLAGILNSVISGPSKEENAMNMPECPRAVLDCTEIAVDSVNCLKCRVQLSSKGRLTVKFIVAAAASGLLTARTNCYGGKISDEKIISESNLIQKNMLQPFSDAVMVDKSLRTDKICDPRHIKIIHPQFVVRLGPVSKVNVKADVGKAIKKMKGFQILRDETSCAEVPYIHDIVTVVMGLVNLSRPIITKKRTSGTRSSNN